MTRSQGAIALVLLASLNAVGFIDRVMVALVAEKIKAEYLVSDFEVGLLGGTAFAVVNTLASVPIAALMGSFLGGSIADRDAQLRLPESGDPLLAANKKLVFDMCREIVQGGHADRVEHYFTEGYIQHNPNSRRAG